VLGRDRLGSWLLVVGGILCWASIGVLGTAVLAISSATELDVRVPPPACVEAAVDWSHRTGAVDSESARARGI
jgi:hypothetical protein